MSNVMTRVQGGIEKHVVPVINKLTANYWFGIVANAVLYIVPFTMVSAIPSLFNVVRTFIPVLPDLTALNTYSFGLVGMFIAFIIPHSVASRRTIRAGL
jgi:PTS system cellobiose-specific IIC component